LRALNVIIRVFKLRARKGSFVEVEDVFDSAGSFGFAWIEGDNGTIGETGAFAEGGGCYLGLGLAMRSGLDSRLLHLLDATVSDVSDKKVKSSSNSCILR
jgi:hypothetical protein